jgi:hypothetical protein
MNSLVFTGLMLFGLIVILIIFVVIRIKLDYLKDSLKNALTIMEGEAKLYRKRTIDSAEQLKNILKKDFEFEEWAKEFRDYYELKGIINGLTMAIRILKFWLPKNL